jgi:TPR repeat protein
MKKRKKNEKNLFLNSTPKKQKSNQELIEEFLKTYHGFYPFISKDKDKARKLIEGKEFDEYKILNAYKKFNGWDCECDLFESLKLFKEIKIEGNKIEKGYACYLLSKIEAKGMISEKNVVKSLEYLEESTTFDNQKSFVKLAKIYQNGREGIQKDPNKMLFYLNRAAELKNIKAITNLARLYSKGSEGIEKNFQFAKQFYEMAANLGHSPSFIHLARFYRDGKEVEKDVKKHFELFNQAAEMKNPAAIRFKKK